jgi:hypothetical protein
MATYARAALPVVKRALPLAGVMIGAAVVAGLVVLGANLLRDDVPTDGFSLARPGRGEVRPDHLADGTPVFAVGHVDGTVSVVSAFDTHVPAHLGKLNWWCPSAVAFENPSHGSKWDERGVKIGGPAPVGLQTWEVTVQGGRVFLGDAQPGAPIGTQPIGPPEVDRDWCVPPEGLVIYHDFPGWLVWDSPADAVRQAPDDWILLEGELVALPGEAGVHLCALGDCDDSALAANVERPPANILFGPLGPGRFMAHVRDGVLVDVTRVVVVQPDVAP